MAADITLASSSCQAGRTSIFEKRGGAGSKERKHDRFCKVHLYNLTSIIMDQVRRFMKFAIVEVVKYAAAM